MEVSKPNEYGVLDEGLREIVASRGRAFAAVRIALSEDTLYRVGVEMQYGHGGFSSPISMHDTEYATLEAARVAGLEELLRRWHRPFPSDPQSVHDELTVMREQIESRIRQPCLL